MSVLSQQASLKTINCSILQFILYTFPAVCWRYGAGTVFSAFVSLVFWGAPAKQIYKITRESVTEITPVGLRVRGLSVWACLL